MHKPHSIGHYHAFYFFNRPKQAGLTLIELIIGMTIGSLISGSLLAMWLNLQSSTIKALQQSHLHQDLRAIHYIMTRDIRRAGYWKWAPGSGLLPENNPFITAANNINIDKTNSSETNDSCLTYSYDRNNDGMVSKNNNEQYGFRLHNQAIEMRIGGAVFNCQSGNWEDITQGDTVITTLSFTLQETYVDSSTNCNTTPYCRIQRLVHMRISGYHNAYPELSITLEENIRIRNDYYTEAG